MTGSTTLLTWLAELLMLLLVAVLVYWGLDAFGTVELAPRMRSFSLEM